jgi:small GTP-binding protein
MANQYPLKIVVVGHVDHGKSSFIGRILYETKSVASDKIQKLKDSDGEIEYAFLLDALEEEQRQGITIDTTQIRFKIEDREILIIDAPGHREFLKNMVSGASAADIAVLIVDAKEGIAEQSLRHAQLLNLIGIREVLVVVNKLDLFDFNKEVFLKIKEGLEEHLKQLDLHAIDWVPVSAKTGHNIADLSIPWYKGKGILKILKDIKSEEKESDQLRLQVQAVFKHLDKRYIFTKVISGTLKKGDRVQIFPSRQSSNISAIFEWKNELIEKNEANVGDSASILLEDDLFVERGNVIIAENDSVSKSNHFYVNFFNFSSRILSEGDRFLLKIGTDESFCELRKIKNVIDSKSLKTKQVNQVESFDTASLELITEKEISFDLAKLLHETSRFVLLNKNEVIGGGIIVEDVAINEPVHSGIEQSDREKLNGHKSALLSIAQDLTEFGYELEKILFKNGIRAIYLRNKHDLLIEYLLKTGHVIIVDDLKKPEYSGLYFHISNKNSKKLETITKQIKE